jgi:hypothetical protein
MHGDFVFQKNNPQNPVVHLRNSSPQANTAIGLQLAFSQDSQSHRQSTRPE